MTLLQNRIAELSRFLGALLFIVNFTGCDKALNLKDPNVNPGVVFDELWHVLDKNYALFPIKNINWDSVYSTNRGQAVEGLSDNELFKLLGKTVEVLKDGHNSLISLTGTSTYENFYKSYPVNFNWNNIRNNYLQNQFKQKGPIIYKIVDNVGYLFYASFSNDVSEPELNEIFAELSTTKGLIIDVRSNTGGSLSNAEMLFSRFINDKRLVRYEVGKKGSARNDFLDPRAFYLSPASTYYSKPIMLLTNRTCFSACNDFAMYMSYLPNVKLVGDQTGGGGAVPADYILSNGWKLRYSSSMTLNPDLQPIESGIVPDIVVGILPIEETNGRDPILEKAYQLLQ